MNDTVCSQLCHNKPLKEQWAKSDGQWYSVPVLATGKTVDKTKQVDTTHAQKLPLGAARFQSQPGQWISKLRFL
jgi:hypothetical protein